MELRNWKPSLTSQFLICPVPYHMDTYRGCTYNCKYCFARDITTFSRRNSIHKEFSYLIGLRADLFQNWVNRTINKDYDYNHAEEVAFKERIPLKIGATADPFPFIETDEKITYNVLKILDDIDYPVQVSTKNPEVLAGYAGDFDNPNWTINVTVTTMDEEYAKILEPNAISPKRRMSAIKKLTDMGIKVFIRVQPFIYPRILTDIEDILIASKDVGCWGFMTEGLKVRVAMPKTEQKLIQEIGDYLDINIRDFYKKELNKTGSDYELSNEHKEEFLDICVELSKKYELEFYNGDNHNYKVGNGCECCGTSVLRDYKILGSDARCRLHGGTNHQSLELQKCNINFTRSTKFDGLTIGEACKQDQINKPNLLWALGEKDE